MRKLGKQVYAYTTVYMNVHMPAIRHERRDTRFRHCFLEAFSSIFYMNGFLHLLGVVHVLCLVAQVFCREGTCMTQRVQQDSMDETQSNAQPNVPHSETAISRG